MKKFFSKRPWGYFENFTHNEKSTVKILTVKPKKRLSLQKHKKRSEFWKFLDNPAKVTLGKKIFKVKKGDEVKVPKGTAHRIEAYSKTVNVLEISFGDFEEHDEIRLQDDFGRK